MNSYDSIATGDGVLGGFSPSAKMGNPFAKCNQKGESFSGLWKLRADENIHCHWTSDGLFGGETFMGNGIFLVTCKWPWQ